MKIRTILTFMIMASATLSGNSIYAACNTPAGITDYIIEEVSIDDNEDYDESFLGEALSLVNAYFDLDISLGIHHWSETKQYKCTDTLDKGYGLYHRKHDRYTQKGGNNFEYAIKSIGTSVIDEIIGGINTEVGGGVEDDDQEFFTEWIEDIVGNISVEVSAGVLTATPSWNWNVDKYIREIEGCPDWVELKYGNKSVSASLTGGSVTFDQDLLPEAFDSILPSIHLKLLVLSSNYSYQAGRADGTNTFTHSARVLFDTYKLYIGGTLDSRGGEVDENTPSSTTTNTVCW